MTKRSDSKDFEARVAARLRASADGLDAATRSRLNRARQAALAELEPAPQRARLWTALAAASVAGLAFGLWRTQTGQAPRRLPVEDDAATELELLLAEDSMEMIEDFDFYLWLAEADAGGERVG